MVGSSNRSLENSTERRNQRADVPARDLYPSETDTPFTTFSWKKADDKLTAQLVRQLAKHDPGDPVQEMSLSDFFKDLTEEQDWHGKEEKEIVRKFRELEKAIRANLSSATVFRIGETKIDIYIVGQTAYGGWAGLKTRAVET